MRVRVRFGNNGAKENFERVREILRVEEKWANGSQLKPKWEGKNKIKGNFGGRGKFEGLWWRSNPPL